MHRWMDPSPNRCTGNKRCLSFEMKKMKRVRRQTERLAKKAHPWYTPGLKAKVSETDYLSLRVTYISRFVATMACEPLSMKTPSKETEYEEKTFELSPNDASDMDQFEEIPSDLMRTPVHSKGNKHRAGGDSGSKFAISHNSQVDMEKPLNWNSSAKLSKSTSKLSASHLNPLSPVFVPSAHYFNNAHGSSTSLVTTPVRSSQTPRDGVRRPFSAVISVGRAKSKEQKYSRGAEDGKAKYESCSMPMRSLKTSTGAPTFPLVYVSNAGTISVVLASDLVIETTVDRSIRVVCHDNFSAYVGARGMSSAILHSKARILHNKENVFCKFMSSNDKLAVFGMQGVLFSMTHLSEAFLVKTNNRGASAVPLDQQVHFPSLDSDYTMRLFYTESKSGNKLIPLCREIVDEATYKRVDDVVVMNINGMIVRYSCEGELEVDARPRHISCNTSLGTLRVRTSAIDVGIQSPEQAYVKFGMKRVHVSRSGMVVAEGNASTSMDHFGRIVSCT